MTLRIFGFSLVSFALGVVFVSATTSVVSSVNNDALISAQDDRAADREAAVICRIKETGKLFFITTYTLE